MNRVLASMSVVLLVLISCIAVQAQEDSLGITGMGFRLGAGWGTLSTNSEIFEAGNAGGFTAGVYLTYSFTPRLSIQPELIFSEKGAGDNNFLYGSGTNLSYLEVPVLLKYNLTRGRRMSPSLYLGPAISTLLSAKIYHDNIFIDDHAYDVKDGMKSLDVGIVLGGELEFQSFRFANLVLDVRYSFGLMNALDPDEWNAGRTIVDEGDWGPIHWTEYDRPLVDEDASIKNRVFSIMIGLKF